MKTNLSRRAFLAQVTCGSYVLAHVNTPTSRWEYQRKTDCIEVVRYAGGCRQIIQRVGSANPSFLALDEARHRLFVVNEIEEFEGLPTGSVESYAVSLKTGRIELLSRRGLSLSGTRPKQLAVSPDGTFLVVAIYGGGAFNVLPILADGTIGRVAQALKEIGCGPDPTEQKAAHPYAVAFHPSGRFVFASDLGSDRLSVFSFDGGRLERLHERKTPAGSGPAEISLDSNGFELSVEHRLKRFRSRYYFDAQSGELRQFDTEA